MLATVMLMVCSSTQQRPSGSTILSDGSNYDAIKLRGSTNLSNCCDGDTTKVEWINSFKLHTDAKPCSIDDGIFHLTTMKSISRKCSPEQRMTINWSAEVRILGLRRGGEMTLRLKILGASKNYLCKHFWCVLLRGTWQHRTVSHHFCNINAHICSLWCT